MNEHIPSRPPMRASHFHILLSLVDGPVHGYQVRREVDARTNGAIVLAAGTLYETLARLERDGLIVETAMPTDVSRDASTRWRFYDITPVGRERLTHEITRLEADVRAARAKVPPVG